MTTEPTRTAVVTGASKGLGLELTKALAADGWRVVVDARDGKLLERAVRGLPAVVPVPGDVADPAHRRQLATVAGRVDLLVNNASRLGPSPQPHLSDYPVDALIAVYAVNVVAPIALTAEVAPTEVVINISSDAAVEAYEGWGGYGSSKAALDHATAILGAERPDLHVYAFDPGDMRTDMHQAAFPGEDISDRPLPSTVVPALLRLVASRPTSGRYRAADLAVPA